MGLETGNGQFGFVLGLRERKAFGWREGKMKPKGKGWNRGEWRGSLVADLGEEDGGMVCLAGGRERRVQGQ